MHSLIRSSCACESIFRQVCRALARGRLAMASPPNKAVALAVKTVRARVFLANAPRRGWRVAERKLEPTTKRAAPTPSAGNLQSPGAEGVGVYQKTPNGT